MTGDNSLDLQFNDTTVCEDLKMLPGILETGKSDAFTINM
jgi:hypothetical protein